MLLWSEWIPQNLYVGILPIKDDGIGRRGLGEVIGLDSGTFVKGFESFFLFLRRVQLT